MLKRTMPICVKSQKYDELVKPQLKAEVVVSEIIGLLEDQDRYVPPHSSRRWWVSLHPAYKSTLPCSRRNKRGENILNKVELKVYTYCPMLNECRDLTSLSQAL